MRLTTAAAIIALAASAASGQEAISVAAIKSVAQPFEDTLILRGRTEADRRVDVRSEIAGLVASPPLRKGARVAAGDVLCEIAEGDRVAELAEAEAFLTEAEQNAAAADQLLKKGYSSETTSNTRRAALEASRARVLRAQLNMERLTIRAPFDGVLETDTAELGSLLQNGSVCATLIALDPMKMVAFAPERSVDALAVGQEVTGRLITGRAIEGRISFVARSADRDTRTYLVEAETPNTDHEIRDGMTVEMMVGLQGEMAHLAPQNALTLDGEGRLGVRLVDNGAALFTPVEILRDESVGVWLSGLPESAEIIVVGQEFVTDGQAVKVEYLDPARIQ